APAACGADRPGVGRGGKPRTRSGRAAAHRGGRPPAAAARRGGGARAETRSPGVARRCRLSTLARAGPRASLHDPARGAPARGRAEDRMTRLEGDDVALKFVHTADWHLGRRFPSFEAADQLKLSRARLEVIDRILGVGEQTGADAILCAGELFDEPDPGKEWWEPLLEKLRKLRSAPPIFLLPGNHDPLVPASVYHADHPFRRGLPAWVHVVDRDEFEHVLSPDAVLYSAPCRSQAGQKDLALSLPGRAAGDERIRIGLVHGSTFDIDGCQMNFPIARDAVLQRGFDYLAIGDTHNFREVPPGARAPTVYPGAPEPTTFAEVDAGYVAVVFVTRRRRAIVR